MAKYSKSAEQGGGGKAEYHFFFVLYSGAKGAFWYASLSCKYFFYLKPKYLLHKSSGMVVLYANINSPRVKDCVFFCLVAVESINLEFA